MLYRILIQNTLQGVENTGYYKTMYIYGIENTGYYNTLYIYGIENTRYYNTLYIYGIENTGYYNTLYIYGIENTGYYNTLYLRNCKKSKKPPLAWQIDSNLTPGEYVKECLFSYFTFILKPIFYTLSSILYTQIRYYQCKIYFKTI